MRAVGIVGVAFLIAAVLLLRHYRDSFALPVAGLVCLVIGVFLARWSRANRRK